MKELFEVLTCPRSQSSQVELRLESTNPESKSNYLSISPHCSMVTKGAVESRKVFSLRPSTHFYSF